MLCGLKNPFRKIFTILEITNEEPLSFLLKRQANNSGQWGYLSDFMKHRHATRSVRISSGYKQTLDLDPSDLLPFSNGSSFLLQIITYLH